MILTLFFFTPHPISRHFPKGAKNTLSVQSFDLGPNFSCWEARPGLLGLPTHKPHESRTTETLMWSLKNLSEIDEWSDVWFESYQ